MRGDIIVITVELVIALALSAPISAFTTFRSSGPTAGASSRARSS
jgi:uncharacterized membrane protein